MKNKKGIFSSGNTAILLKCLGIAVLFFIMTKLSKTYTSTISYKLNYTSYPQSQVPSRALEENMKVSLEASGFNLLKAKLLGRNELKVPLDNFEGKNFILCNENLSFFNSLLSDGYRIVRIHRDSLPLYFSKKISKKVPVQLLSNITFAHQYDSMEDILVEPDSVLISGAESVVNQVDHWPTEKLELNEINKTKEGFVALQTVDSLNIEMEPSKIKYLQTVEEYTEATVDVKVKLVNQPKSSEIIIFPKNVSLRYQVGLSNYEKSQNDYFEIVADFKDMDLSKSKTLDLSITSVSAYIKKYKIVPETVDFILYKD